MRSRTDFMNILGKPNCEDKIPSIVENHYLKFRYVYDLFKYIFSVEGVEESVKSIVSEDNDENSLIISVKFKKDTDLNIITDLINEFISENDSGDLELYTEVVSSNKLNISISANFIEEDIYDDNRLSTD